MSSPRPMPTRPARGLVDLASSVTSSFMPASPIVQEIVASDLSEMPCEEAADEPSDDRSESGEEPGNGPTLYRQPHGIASGYSRPAVLPEPVGEPVLTKGEKKESRKQERNLLRDNHLLPPKHSSSSGGSVVKRAYWRLFGAQDGEPAGGGSNPTETSPLLQDRQPEGPSPDSAQLDEQWNAALASGSLQTTWRREAKTIAGYSQSLIVTFVLQYSINMASIFFIGHIGTMELGAISLATMTANITCYAPLQGLATSLDTLCSQAYGSGHKHLVGLQFQRMACFLLCLCIPIAILWLFAGDVLATMIPDAGAAQLAGLYLRVTIAGIPAYALFECGKRFVQAQGLFAPTTYVLVIVTPLNLVLLWLFIYQLEWGFIGAPLAVTITQNLMPLLLVLYVALVDGSQCWGGFNSRAWTNWGPMIRLSVPGMVMVVAESLAFEILTLAASRLGTEYLAAQSILTTLTTMTFQIPFPLSIAASTRIANLIGANLVQNAKTSAKVAVCGGFLVATFNMVLLSTLRHQLPLAFTSDQDVVALVAEIMPLVAVMQVFDGTAAIAHGLLRGIGRQHFGGYVNLLSYYLVALPISFGFAFGLGWNLTGLWLGVTCGLVLVAICEYLYVYLVDWEHSVREAEHRNATA